MSTIFANQVTKTVEVPGDAPNTVTVRKLSGLQLHEAQQINTPGTQILWRHKLIEMGLTAWTYPEPLTPDLLKELDDEAANFIAGEILRLTKPGLFLTPDEVEAERKNDLSGSIVPSMAPRRGRPRSRARRPAAPKANG